MQGLQVYLHSMKLEGQRSGEPNIGWSTMERVKE